MLPLKEFVGSIINSFLGPNKSNKLLIQDEDVAVVRCPLYIFQNAHFQDPLSSLIEETLFAHHDLYGCSTLSLLTMWYFWNEEFKVAVEEGCEMQTIIKHSQNILERIISALSEIALSTEKLFCKKHYSKTLPKVKQTLNPVPISIQYTSRHFSPSQNSDLDDNGLYESLLDETELNMIVRSFDHDEDSETCKLVLECWKKQISSRSHSIFKTDGLFICPINLRCSSSTLIEGLLIKSNLTHSWYQDKKTTFTNKVLIIQGSITYEYVHLGFSPKVTLTIQKQSLVTKKEVWKRKTCDYIKQIKVDVLLIKGDIDPEISTFCIAHSVLPLANIPLKAFQILCSLIQYRPCTYILDCKKEDIIYNLVIKEWKPNDITLDGQYFLINKNFDFTLQTIVLCHPSAALLEKLKHQIHHLISRLSLSFTSHRLLPGSGKTERWCCEYLRKLPEFQNFSDPISRIMTALANGFQNYSTVVCKKKMLTSNESPKIVDEMSSKLSAWRSALSLVLLTLQCDAAIVNGHHDFKSEFVDLCINSL